MQQRSRRGYFLILAILVSLGVALASCDQSATSPRPAEPIHVLVPVYLIGDIVKQIGGDRVDVAWWVESGQSLDDLQETPARRSQLRSADLIITRGEVDPWTMEQMESEFERRRVLRVDKMYSAATAGPREYIWIDPSVALELADEITERLAARDPQREKTFRANRVRFRAEVIAVSDRMRRALDNAKVRSAFLTLDRGFVPLANRFSLVEARVDKINLADPTPYGVKTLRARAKEVGTVAVFVNDQTPGPLRSDWEARLGLMVLGLDAVGSSAAGSGRSTYLEVLQYNFDQMLKGLTAPGSVNAAIAVPGTEIQPESDPLPATTTEANPTSAPAQDRRFAPLWESSPQSPSRVVGPMTQPVQGKSLRQPWQPPSFSPVTPYAPPATPPAGTRTSKSP